MSQQRILFVCIHNSARSQMAEAWVNYLCNEHWIAASAGLTPGTLNPRVVTVMQEVGIDISHKQTRSVHSLLDNDQVFDFVITVCDESSAESCPVFPGKAQRLHWGFPDPSTFTGSEAECLAATRQIRDQIRDQVKNWCQTHCLNE